jgi:phosphatidylglycerophosphate synthase
MRRTSMFAIIADALTISRLIAAGILLWLGVQGPNRLPAAILVGVLAWTTDQLDGWAARRASTPTRLAHADFAIDTTLYACTLGYLTLAGFVPLVPTLVFAAVALTTSLVYRRKAISIFWLRLIDLTCLIVIFRYQPIIGYTLIVWLAVLGIIYRKRILVRVPHWLAELRSLLRLRARSDEKT